MIRSVIVSNEPQSGNALAEMLQTHCDDIHIIEVAYNIEKGSSIVQQYRPELTFWDVFLAIDKAIPIADGFPFPVFQGIYVTTYEHCARAEVRCRAFDYLLKPVALSSLAYTIERFRLLHASVEQYTRKAHGVTGIPVPLRRIAVPTIHDIQFVEIERIVRLEAERNYTIFYLTDLSTITVARTLKEYEYLFVGMPFLRVHQSHIINLNNVVRYIRGKGGFAVMCDGSVVCVSPRKKAEFMCGIQGIAVF